MDDSRVIAAIRAGRTEMFAALVEKYAGSVFRIVRSAIRHEADAEDLAQEVFLASFNSLDRLRDPGRFRAHLVAIASRKVIDHLRRKKVRSRVQELSEEPVAPAPDSGRTAELADAVGRVVDGMDDESRLYFSLRHHEGLSCVQIARLLDKPEGTVYSRISRIHAAIRRAMEIGK